MAKNDKRFSVLIPAKNKYIPIVRRYIVEVLVAFNFSGSSLYKMETIVDEACLKISKEVEKCPNMLWFDIKFDINDNGFSFEMSQQQQEYLFYNDNEKNTDDICSINSCEIGIIERYCHSARLDLLDGKIRQAKINRSTEVI